MKIIVVWMAGTLNSHLIKFVVINSQGFQIGEVQYPLGPGRDRSVFLWVAPLVRSQNRGNSQLDNFDFCGNILCLNSELLTKAGRVPEEIKIRAYQNIREWNVQVVSADAKLSSRLRGYAHCCGGEGCSCWQHGATLTAAAFSWSSAYCIARETGAGVV